MPGLRFLHCILSKGWFAMKRVLLLVALLGLAAVWIAGCSSRKTGAVPAPSSSGIASAHGPSGAALDTASQAGTGMPMVAPIPAQTGGTATAAAGLQWRLPPHWEVQAERPMRVATYSIPPVGGDTEGAECAVYYFGANQGGGVDANFERWIGQFQPATSSRRSTRQVNGLEVSLLDASGTYTSPGGPMMQSQGNKPGWRLLGAIVVGPQGAVFFKLTGPAKTVAVASASFDELIGSLRKH
jgi:hypothetical protein